MDKPPWWTKGGRYEHPPCYADIAYRKEHGRWKGGQAPPWVQEREGYNDTELELLALKVELFRLCSLMMGDELT